MSERPSKSQKFDKQEKLHRLMLMHDKTGLKGVLLRRKFNYTHAPNEVSLSYVNRNVTADKHAQWLKGRGIPRTPGSGRKKAITPAMTPKVREWIEDDSILKKKIPGLIKRHFGVTVTPETISNNFKKSPGNPEGYVPHVTPLSTPLSADDELVRLEYAKNGPILKFSFYNYEDIGNFINLPKAWRERRLFIAWWDHKPFYLGAFHRHNSRQCRFKHSDKSKRKSLTPGRKEKYQPKFMVFGLLGWQFSASYFHCHRRRNQRRSRNDDDELVYKYTFEHISVNQAELIAAAKAFIPVLKENGIKVLIGDCDTKLHNKKLAEILWAEGIFLWPGGGKSCGNHPCGYPPRSHDCDPCELWFSIWQDDASELMKKSKKTMLNWKRALESSQNAMQKARWQVFINNQPKVMQTIIANDGGRTKY